MKSREELEEEKMSCLFLLEEAKKMHDFDQAFVLAMRIEEIEEILRHIDNNMYRSK